MATPTTQQIQQVQANLANLISLNQSLLLGGNIRIENAYTLLSMDDDSDPGLQVGVNLMDSAFLIAGDEVPVVGTVAATFCCSLLASYTDSQPPTLQAAASSLLNRFQLTNYQFNSDLEMFHSNVEQYWDVVYSGTVVNAFGEYPVSGSLSDLANVVIPGPDDEGYQEIVNVLVYGTDQMVWYTLLQNFVIINYGDSKIMVKGLENYWGDDTKEQQQEGIATFYAKHPGGYFNQLQYVGGRKPYYEFNNYFLGKEKSDYLSVEASNYLFNNLYEDVPNPNATQNTYTQGLYARQFVFNNMGIAQQSS